MSKVKEHYFEEIGTGIEGLSTVPEKINRRWFYVCNDSTCMTETTDSMFCEKHGPQPPKEVVTPIKEVVLTARMSLLVYDFLVSMAKVMAFGCIKYSEEDWRNNSKVTVKGRLDSLGRHFAKVTSETESDIDSDHGESHFASIAVNAMICWWIVKFRPERDDRYKGTK